MEWAERDTLAAGIGRSKLLRNCARLLAGRVIAEPPARFEIRQRIRSNHLHLNLAVFSVASLVGGRIREHVLITQLQTDPGCDARQVLRARCSQGAAAGLLR